MIRAGNVLTHSFPGWPIQSPAMIFGPCPLASRSSALSIWLYSASVALGRAYQLYMWISFISTMSHASSECSIILYLELWFRCGSLIKVIWIPFSRMICESNSCATSQWLRLICISLLSDLHWGSSCTSGRTWIQQSGHGKAEKWILPRIENKPIIGFDKTNGEDAHGMLKRNREPSHAQYNKSVSLSAQVFTKSTETRQWNAEDRTMGIEDSRN